MCETVGWLSCCTIAAGGAGGWHDSSEPPPPPGLQQEVTPLSPTYSEAPFLDQPVAVSVGVLNLGVVPIQFLAHDTSKRAQGGSYPRDTLWRPRDGSSGVHAKRVCNGVAGWASHTSSFPLNGRTAAGAGTPVPALLPRVLVAPQITGPRHDRRAVREARGPRAAGERRLVREGGVGEPQPRAVADVAVVEGRRGGPERLRPGTQRAVACRRPDKPQAVRIAGAPVQAALRKMRGR